MKVYLFLLKVFYYHSFSFLKERKKSDFVRLLWIRVEKVEMVSFLSYTQYRRCNVLFIGEIIRFAKNILYFLSIYSN